jgi:hypothetical protein
VTFCISFGRWGGFYLHRDYTTRICLGWVALTFFPCDLDRLFTQHHETVETLSGMIDDLCRELKRKQA